MSWKRTVRTVSPQISVLRKSAVEGRCPKRPVLKKAAEPRSVGTRSLDGWNCCEK
jgi:hypothetical protein